MSLRLIGNKCTAIRNKKQLGVIILEHYPLQEGVEDLITNNFEKVKIIYSKFIYIYIYIYIYIIIVTQIQKK